MCGCDFVYYFVGVHVLCPICKVGSLKETSTGSFPVISCACGFHFQTHQEPLYGVLEDFQETIAAAFMAHRYILFEFVIGVGACFSSF